MIKSKPVELARTNAAWPGEGVNDEDRYTVRLQGPAPATNPFILGNPSGSDLRRDDAFEFASLRFVLGYRF